MATEMKAPAEEPGSKPTLMSLPFELRKKIFAFAERSGDELKVFLCDCHSPPEWGEKRMKPDQCATQYRPPPPPSRPLLRVSHQVRAEAKDIVYQHRTLIACSILCATDPFKVMTEDEMNMTKNVLITRTLHKSKISSPTNEFKRRYMQYIRDELQGSHFENAKLIRIEMKDEGRYYLTFDYLKFEYESQVGRPKKGASRGAKRGFVSVFEVDAFSVIRNDERIWRDQDDSWRKFLTFPHGPREGWVQSRRAVMRRRRSRNT